MSGMTNDSSSSICLIIDFWLSKQKKNVNFFSIIVVDVCCCCWRISTIIFSAIFQMFFIIIIIIYISPIIFFSLSLCLLFVGHGWFQSGDSQEKNNLKNHSIDSHLITTIYLRSKWHQMIRMVIIIIFD